MNLTFEPIPTDEIFPGLTGVWNDQVKDYYSQALSLTDLQIDSVRLLGKHNVMEEAFNLIPGCKVLEFGFIPIASTDSGDIYVVDYRTGKVFELSHEKYNLDSICPGWKSDYSGFMEDIPITQINIIKTACHSFSEVEKFLNWMLVQ